MEYRCEPCKYSTKHKHHLARHLRTERHAMTTAPKQQQPNEDYRLIVGQEIITTQADITTRLIELITSAYNTYMTDSSFYANALDLDSITNESMMLNQLASTYKLMDCDDDSLKPLVKFEKVLKIERGSHRIRELIKNASDDYSTLFDVMEWVNANPNWESYISSESEVSSVDRFRANCVRSFKHTYAGHRRNPDIDPWFKKSWLSIETLWNSTHHTE